MQLSIDIGGIALMMGVAGVLTWYKTNNSVRSGAAIVRHTNSEAQEKSIAQASPSRVCRRLGTCAAVDRPNGLKDGTDAPVVTPPVRGGDQVLHVLGRLPGHQILVHGVHRAHGDRERDRVGGARRPPAGGEVLQSADLSDRAHVPAVGTHGQHGGLFESAVPENVVARAASTCSSRDACGCVLTQPFMFVPWAPGPAKPTDDDVGSHYATPTVGRTAPRGGDVADDTAPAGDAL